MGEGMGVRKFYFDKWVDGVKKLLLCDCLGSQTVDSDAISQATGLTCTKVMTHACGAQVIRGHGVAVHCHHLPAQITKQDRGGTPGAGQAHHQGTARRRKAAHAGSVRKNSVKPMPANISAISQNRTMILVSLHPAISKW